MIVRPPVSHAYTVLASLSTDRAATADRLMKKFASGAIDMPSHFVIHHEKCKIVKLSLDPSSDRCTCVPCYLPMHAKA